MLLPLRPDSMVSGRLREIGAGYIVLGRDLRVEVPTDLTPVGYQVGSWCTVTLTQDRDRIIAKHITHSEGAERPKPHPDSPPE